MTERGHTTVSGRSLGTSRRTVMPWLAVSMVAAILVVTSVGYWDSRRESATALRDFGTEHSFYAQGIAAALDAPLAASATDTDVVRRLHALERPGSTVVVLKRPGVATWTRVDGSPVVAPSLPLTLQEAGAWTRMSREESARLGLPARTSVAGIAQIDAGSFGQALMAIITTAQPERDRELRAEARLVLSVLLCGGLVLAFGGIALRKQRAELQHAGRLDVAEVERQRDERLVRADKLATLGALATGIAHEVSTPLGVIVGRAEQIAPKLAHDERGRHAVQAILEQSDRIRTVIRGFLALARGDAPPFDHVDPSSIAAKSIDLVEHRFAKAGVTLTSDVAPNLSQIACEARLLEQALVNLLLNACEACADGGHVALQVRGDAERVAFVVVDDGVGVEAESAASILQPFFTTKASGEGTGLGLAIANEIVSHHRGTLTIASQVTSGPRETRACIEIPAAEVRA